MWGGAPKRRVRQANPEEVPVAIVVGVGYFLWLIVKITFRGVGWVFYWCVWHDPNDAGGAIVKKGSLRQRDDWQKEWRKVRSAFIRLCEKTLGAANLYCMICDHAFPTEGKRGITVDHRSSVDWDATKSFDFENLQLACESCNASKGNRMGRVDDRRPQKLRVAAAAERRRYLARYKGVDPIHKIIERHEAERPGLGRSMMAWLKDG